MTEHLRLEENANAPEATGRSRDGQRLALVHERLRDAILRGEVPAGHTTTQASLAAEFGIGRTPLREALRMLQREGLVVSEPNRRVRIAGLAAPDAEDLYILRISIEAVAILVTVPQLVSADLAELEGLLAKMDHYMQTRDNIGFRQPHRAFHLLLVSGSGPRGVEMIGQLFDHAERYRLAFGANTPAAAEERRIEHRSIVDAVAAGDADRATRLLVAHYLHTVELIFEALDPGHDLARLRTAIEAVAPGAESALRKIAKRSHADR
jgi:DNA-binding GntR family transcriptional regulator